MFKKGKSAVEGDPKKSWSGIKTEAVAEYEEVGLEKNSHAGRRQPSQRIICQRSISSFFNFAYMFIFFRPLQLSLILKRQKK